MKLSLSVRIAESADKRSLSLPFEKFAALVRQSGYHAVCMRASAGGIQTPREKLAAMRAVTDRLKLAVSMVTSDFNVPLNNERGPEALRDIGPHLEVVKTFGASLLRVCLKTEKDIRWAQRAADAAAEQGIRLAHQCHTGSLFETVDHIVEVLHRVDRKNFGLIYEPANLMLCGQDYGREVLRRLAPWIMNVYLQNHRLNEKGRESLVTWVRGEVRYDLIPLWERGGVDFEEVFAGLKDIGYRGYVTVHQAYAALMGPEDAAVKSQAYLRKGGRFDPPIVE
ncbi:MAG: sugar phosphate isomerase/epimerase [Planctomycetes bacterium]|nr:sugar phosphate isomerase/epimerase [Planctomycetota bacterium]